MNLVKHILMSSFVIQILIGPFIIVESRSEEAELSEVVIAAPIPEFRETTIELPGTLTVPNNFEATRIIQRTPGGVYVVGAERFEDKYSLNFQDTVSHVPGVYATKRFAEEVRISIRGSGIERNFHQKGLTGFQDGVPFGAADGSGDYQEIDTLAIQRIEIHKGGNAMQFGSTTLGGSINMISKTGHSNPGNQLRLEMGSDDTFRGNIQSGRVFDDGSDMFFSLSGTNSDGFRQHADQKNIKFTSNSGIKLSDQVETRFYFSSNYINLELPNTVNFAKALGDPEAAKPSALTDDEHRDIISHRFSNKTTFDLGGGHQMDIGAFAFWKDLYHPITSFVGVIDQESTNFGLFTKNSGSYKIGNNLNRYRFGLTTHFGETDAKVWANNSGNAGGLTSNADQSAQNIVLYGENTFYIQPTLALITSMQYLWSNRDVFDKLTPSETDSSDYESWNPKIGFLYKPSEKIQIFGNVSKSYEPPDFSDLTQGSTSGFINLEAQQAWTVEVGTRGERGSVAWDISLYRAWLRDEILKFTTGGGFPATGFNAEDTVHQGAEVGLGFQLGKSLLTDGDSLKWWNAYTYSNFFFNGDPQFEDNTIPGQPPHFYNTELRYDHPDKWFVSANMLAASNADVDFNNTFVAPGYAIVGIGAGYEINKRTSLFFEGRNLFNKEYISNFSTAVTATSSSNLFYAGDLRRFFGGIRISF
ncbi:MAG: TonB-dependent receptor [Nitrospina sp.]|nr:TonB-dependent receptor [Nitrospina sp.]MBT3877215.1 TonB-dependent receptor [Nitrospina sp.]MBT4046914.1 TonB-dependent receptor [Nitrospina sp.]MBT4557364.1 TonB-dependent receptor [Nitrospina sp.]MBT5652601.1 TonB-dependent receptor [Nitrospina sp.]